MFLDFSLGKKTEVNYILPKLYLNCTPEIQVLEKIPSQTLWRKIKSISLKETEEKI